MSPPPPRSTLFPYTTLFRSLRLQDREQQLDFVGIVTRPDAEAVAGLIDEPGTREIDDDVARFLFRVRPAERHAGAEARADRRVPPVAALDDRPFCLVRARRRRKRARL